MPDLVMHTYFADKVYRNINDNIRNHIQNYDLFSFASIGPDPFFFYKFLDKKQNKEVREIGNIMHREKSQLFFINLINKLEKIEKKDLLFSYVCGLITHYVLDKTIHPYVFHKTGVYDETTGEGLEYRGQHTKLERAMDSFVIRNVYHSIPWKYKLHKEVLKLKHFPNEITLPISEVYKETYGFENIDKLLNEALEDQIKFYKFIYDPFGFKNFFFKLIDKKTIGLDYKVLSYYHKEINDVDIFNKNGNEWTNPVDFTKTSKDSVFILIDKASKESLEIIEAVYRKVYLQDQINLKEIFKNESYLTGLDEDDQRSMTFFNKIFK